MIKSENQKKRNHFIHFFYTTCTSNNLTCGTAGTGSSGWKSTSCTWSCGWHCLYSFWRRLRTPAGGARGGHTLFSASRWLSVGSCGRPVSFCWGGHQEQSTSLVPSLPLAAADSDAAPSGTAPSTQQRLSLSWESSQCLHPAEGKPQSFVSLVCSYPDFLQV